MVDDGEVARVGPYRSVARRSLKGHRIERQTKALKEIEQALLPTLLELGICLSF